MIPSVSLKSLGVTAKSGWGTTNPESEMSLKTKLRTKLGTNSYMWGSYVYQVLITISAGQDRGETREIASRKA